MEAHEDMKTFESGAVRDGGQKPALDLISPHLLMRLGEWLRFAAEDRKPQPYPRRNWEKGLSFSHTVGCLERHIQKYKLGLCSEDHLAAVAFNVMALIHFEEEIKAGRLPTSLDDMPHYADRDKIVVQVTKFGGSTQRQDALADLLGTTVKAFHETFGLDPAKLGDDRTVVQAVALDSLGQPFTKAPTAPVGSTLKTPDGKTYVYAHKDGQGNLHTAAPFTVYLCGPITGQEVDHLWRARTTEELKDHGIKTLDPLRGKHPKCIENNGLSYMGQLAAPEIASRDELDIQEADVIFAHFPYDPPRQSIGSLMEMGAAAIGFKKPVILCSGVKVFNEHLFCRNFCTLEPDFEQALQRIIAMAQVRRR